jgi:hypothetical protein
VYARSLCAAALLTCGSLPIASGTPVRPAMMGEPVAPGVTYRTFAVDTARGKVNVHVVNVDLRRRGVWAGLLYPGAVADREPATRMAQEQDAVAAINGDFFDITEDQHPGVPATDAPSGPAVADRRALKAAVPPAQRFGWPLPPGGDNEEVFGVGIDGVARTGRLSLRGRIRTPRGTLPLRGLNQYALPEDGIGVFTPQWGRASRARAACGTDDYRAAPCTPDTREVTVHDGLVETASDTLGAGAIGADDLVLVGRGVGAEKLRTLRPGTPVHVEWSLTSTSPVPFAFALGAHRLLREHRPVPGLDTDTPEPRSAVGISDHGHTLRLLATDGREDSSGLTLRELADVLASLDCDQAAYLDGGNSTTLVTKDPDSGLPVVRNRLENGQRPVPNGIAIHVGEARG